MSKEENKEIKKESKKDSKKEVNKDKEVINELLVKLDEAKDKYLYALAEMKDLHKTYEKENKTSIKYITYDLMYELLPLYDIFSMVLENENIPKEVSSYFKGFELVFNKFTQILENKGVSEISAVVGDKFDHKVHNGMESFEVEDVTLDNTIKEVLLKGYKIDDRVLRPASVIVNNYKCEEEIKESIDEEEIEDEEVFHQEEVEEEVEEEKVINRNKGE